MGYQNFFATKLYTDIGASDTTITLETPPTVTSGRLTLEARNSSKREIISYTGVSGNQITGVTRGVGGTSASIHTKNALVEMNVTAEDLADALAVPSDIETRFNEVISDHVASGLVWTDDTGLTADMSAGVAYINGIRLSVSAISNHAFTASKDTYVDLGDNGVVDYNEVANGAAVPVLTASHLRLAKVVTNATDTTSILLYQNTNSFIKDDGWQYNKMPAVSTVVHNGNHNFTLTHAASISPWVSIGNRRQFIRALPANQYMGNFGGTNQYFTKVAPTGTLSTITNNFTIVGFARIASYPSEVAICGRGDAGGNNGFFFDVAATGQLGIVIKNGGAGNSRSVFTNQSISIGRNVPVAVSFASGTVALYIDGVPVPMGAPAVSGTAPTTAGLGGDWSIGRWGAYAGLYFPGWLSNFAVFDAVLSAATIKKYATHPLTGAEANCIGAWSLDNNAVNQQAPGTNDLTATNGAAFTAIAPFGNNGRSSVIEYGVTTSLSADGLTETVQCPESCSLPEGTNTIQSQAFSYAARPYGFPDDVRFSLLAIESTYNTSVVNGVARFCTPIVYERIRYVNTGTATACFMFVSVVGTEKIVTGYCPTGTVDLTVLYPPLAFVISPIVAAATGAAGAYNTFAMALGQSTTGFTARTVDTGGSARAEAISFQARGQ
jgi:hypothetical protein